MLQLNGVEIYVSGVPGHFSGADECALRLSWRIGDWLVSTVAGYRPLGGPQKTVGLGRYGETYVFRVRWSDDVPEGEHDGREIWGLGVAERDTRVAERQHYTVAEAVALGVKHGVTTDAELADYLSSRLSAGSTIIASPLGFGS